MTGVHKKLTIIFGVLGVALLVAAAILALLRPPAPSPAAATLKAHTTAPRPTATQQPSPTPTRTTAPSSTPTTATPTEIPSGATLTAPGTQLDASAVAAISIQDATAVSYLTLRADAPEHVTGAAAATARTAAHQAETTTVYRAKITARALTGSVTIPATAITDITITTHPGSSELTNAATLHLEHDAGLQDDPLTLTTSKAATWYVYAFSTDGNTPIGVQYATPNGQYAAPITWLNPASKQILIP